MPKALEGMEALSGKQTKKKVKRESCEILKCSSVSFHNFKGTSYASWGFPGGSDGKVFACNAGDPGSIPGSERSPGEGNGNPIHCFCLENPMDRGAQ